MKKHKNLYAVILAGGIGTRFWPVSRKSNPKQFLNITGKGTLLQETLARIKPQVRGSHIYIVTNAAYRKAIEQQVARFKIPKANILLEPKGKNTAPAICWAAAKIHKISPNAVMVVLPSDHIILNRSKFQKILGKAVRLAEENYLVTLGIVPTRPETGYGYLKTVKTKTNGRSIVKVQQFTEKPSLSKAKQFLKKNREPRGVHGHKPNAVYGYYWNSGMFVWKSAVILREFQKYLPKIYRVLVGAGLPRTEAPSRGVLGTEVKPAPTGRDYINKVWPHLPNISIDYGILEKAKNVAAVPAVGIHWSDLGSWESLIEVLTKDHCGNIFKGNIVSVNCKDTLVWGDKKVIAPVGLDNMIIIDTPDALLVCRKDCSQAVKDVVSILQKNNRTET